MKKIVIFNVGGALSAYGEFDDKKFMVDLGSNADFSPVNDFLIPLTYKKQFAIGSGEYNNGKYTIDQLFLSHLDKDHISDYISFQKYFFGNFMTCPNDNSQQQEIFKINRKYLGVLGESQTYVLNDMLKRTTEHPFVPVMTKENPLVSIIEGVSLFYLKPGVCESEEILKQGYANNISLVLFIKVGNKTVLLPGDMLKDGMNYIIDNELEFKSLLEKEGIDYLVAPHHGLQTSFSKVLFDTMKRNKTRLNIISEKLRNADSNENRSDVDGRYYNKEYCTGNNSLKKYGVKTSLGHIVIDFDTPENEIKQYSDIEDVIEEFCN